MFTHIQGNKQLKNRFPLLILCLDHKKVVKTRNSCVLDYINNNAKGQLFIEKSKNLINVIFATKKVLEPMFFAKILTRFIKIKKLAYYILF